MLYWLSAQWYEKLHYFKISVYFIFVTGTNSKQDIKNLLDTFQKNKQKPYTIAITTYSKLRGNARYKDLYLDLPWLSVCLDEAHTVRNPETQACQLLQQIQGEYRFCLTGKFVVCVLCYKHMCIIAFLYKQELRCRTKKKISSIYCCGYHRINGYQDMTPLLKTHTAHELMKTLRAIMKLHIRLCWGGWKEITWPACSQVCKVFAEICWIWSTKSHLYDRKNLRCSLVGWWWRRKQNTQIFCCALGKWQDAMARHKSGQDTMR